MTTRTHVPIEEKVAVMEALHSAIRQRDELMAALHKANAALSAFLPIAHSWAVELDRETWQLAEVDVSLSRARAAIAKVEGV